MSYLMDIMKSDMEIFLSKRYEKMLIGVFCVCIIYGV